MQNLLFVVKKEANGFMAGFLFYMIIGLGMLFFNATTLFYMKEDKLLSVCVPTHKRPDLLRRNLLSITNENVDLDDVELLVSDDSDDDDAREIVNRIKKSSNFEISYNKHQQTKNVTSESKQAYNVNKLIQLSRGKYIYIIHDDDFIVKGGLKKIIGEIRNNEDKYKVFLFGVRVVNLSGKVIKVQRIKKNTIYSNVDAVKKLTSNSSFVRTPAIIISREVYNSVGLYDAATQIPLDFDMWSRVFPYYNVYHSKFVVANYTNHVNNQTNQMFDEKYLRIILNIFCRLRNKRVLNDSEFVKNQSEFCHQWILAGVYRNIMSGKFERARKVYKLFDLDEVRMMPLSYRWLLVRLAFQFLLLFSYAR